MIQAFSKNSYFNNLIKFKMKNRRNTTLLTLVKLKMHIIFGCLEKLKATGSIGGL